MTDYRDALSPLTSLTHAERARAREIAQASPDALFSAVEAALGQGEDTLELMQRVMREVRT